MKSLSRKQHWEKIFQTKKLNEVSWFQPTPQTSLNFIRQYNISKTGKIIDVGGGDSLLVDHLLNEGFQNITVLDISENAIERAKQRLGNRAEKVKWIVADAAKFRSEEKYDLWHDRAAFHFLTDENDISSYIDNAKNSINLGGVLVIGTFSEDGPKKCSGIEIKQYSENSMVERLKDSFEKIKCLKIDHETPSGTIQNFVFCSFRKPQAVFI